MTYIEIPHLRSFSIDAQTALSTQKEKKNYQNAAITFKSQVAVTGKKWKTFDRAALLCQPWILSGSHHWHAEHSPGFQTADILKLRTQPEAWTGSPRGQHTDLHANTRSGQFAGLDPEEHPSLQNTANTWEYPSMGMCFSTLKRWWEREGEERKDGVLCEIARCLSTGQRGKGCTTMLSEEGRGARSWYMSPCFSGACLRLERRC